jgi:hypothetical protein
MAVGKASKKLGEIFQPSIEYRSDIQKFPGYKSNDMVYGEIMVKSFPILKSTMKLKPCDEFWDMGCGVGKLTLWMGLTTKVKQSAGNLTLMSQINSNIRCGTSSKTIRRSCLDTEEFQQYIVTSNRGSANLILSWRYFARSLVDVSYCGVCQQF